LKKNVTAVVRDRVGQAVTRRLRANGYFTCGDIHIANYILADARQQLAG
jgi:hypothetical protein